MQQLTGSEKQIEWAEKIRARLLEEGNKLLEEWEKDENGALKRYMEAHGKLPAGHIRRIANTKYVLAQCENEMKADWFISHSDDCIYGIKEGE